MKGLAEAKALRETRSLPQVRAGLLEFVAELAAAVAAGDTLAPLPAPEGDETLCLRPMPVGRN